MKWSVQTAFFLLFAASVAMGNECFVSGITVDASGRPVEGATVFAYVPPLGWESLIVTYRSIEGGEFSVPYDCRSAKAKLFIVAPYDSEKDFVPLRPPFSVSKKVAPLLSGKRLPSIRTGTYRIGRVVIPEHFPVFVRLIGADGRNLLPNQHTFDFWLKIGLGKSNWLMWGSLSRNDWSLTTKERNQTLKMLLPEGRWTIGASFTGNKGPYFFADKLVEVKRSEEPQEFVLRMLED